MHLVQFMDAFYHHYLFYNVWHAISVEMIVVREDYFARNFVSEAAFTQFMKLSSHIFEFWMES